MGQNGITQSFLANAMDLLGKYELVRVRLPDGMHTWATVRALERLLDAVSVLKIGFTVTMYRCALTRVKGVERHSGTG